VREAARPVTERECAQEKALLQRSFVAVRHATTLLSKTEAAFCSQAIWSLVISSTDRRERRRSLPCLPLFSSILQKARKSWAVETNPPTGLIARHQPFNLFRRHAETGILHAERVLVPARWWVCEALWKVPPLRRLACAAVLWQGLRYRRRSVLARVWMCLRSLLLGRHPNAKA
jgi:hypothetical protein